MNDPNNNLAIVYIARQKSGIESLHNFLNGYRNTSTGIDNDLIVILKGFSNPVELEPWRKSLSWFDHKEQHIADFGYDVHAYYAAARLLPHKYLCFLNSHSVPISNDWLRILHNHVTKPDVGVVGCTGSWESFLTDSLGITKSINSFLFKPFPNAHLRTNAFIISRELMKLVWPMFVSCKYSSHVWESGKNGFTNHIQKRGLKVLVVGRDGIAYDSKHWPDSKTFRIGQQENLLMDDNQTRLYEKADDKTRKLLTKITWNI